MNLLTIDEAAERLGCSDTHVYALIATKKLRRFNVSAKADEGATKTRVADVDVQKLADAAAEYSTSLSYTDAAKRLGCSRPHIYDLVRLGKLRSSDFVTAAGTTRARITAADLDAYIAAAEMPVAS